MVQKEIFRLGVEVLYPDDGWSKQRMIEQLREKLGDKEKPPDEEEKGFIQRILTRVSLPS